MLGEIHCLANDFPDYQRQLEKLLAEDEAFAAKNTEYNSIDERIRTLELDGAPIGDEDMHRLKQTRAQLKDQLYQALKNA